MPHTSPFFSNTTGYSGEVSLLDDLVREQIKMFGVDILYMPRKMINLDRLLHESSKNVFELALPIPMYIKTFDGYDNGLEVLSKFGVRSSDEITLQMSRSEFTTHYSPFLKSYYNSNAGRDETEQLDSLAGETDSRPKEGDLIYFPFDDGIFEIKYVMFDQPFFQLGRGYVFEIQCEKFEYSGETFSTGYDEVDDTTIEPDYYRMEFDLRVDTRNSTFLKKERVKIYPLADCDINAIDGGDAFYVDFHDRLDGYDVFATMSDDRADGDGAKLPPENFIFFMDGGDVFAQPTTFADGGISRNIISNEPYNPADKFGSDWLEISGGVANQEFNPDPLENVEGGGAPERPEYENWAGNGDAVETYPEQVEDGGDAMQDLGFCGTDIFRLYKDAGYIHRVEVVEATVENWDKPGMYLTVGDITDLDPDQMSGRTGDRPQEIDMNKFDNVMIVGQSSGAVWFSQRAGTQQQAFNDELVIQEEFNQIKIDDLADSNPFGFV